MKEIRSGRPAIFIIDGQIHYRRVKSIVALEDGTYAVFDDGCVKDALKVPIDQVFTSKEEFEEYMTKGEK